MKLRFTKKTFLFKRPSGTSRGILKEKHSWFIEIWNATNPKIIGFGECSIIPGLSPEYISIEQYEKKLKELSANPTIDISEWPSIKFGLECALRDLENGGKRIYFNNDFVKGTLKLPINGLVWMGDENFMREQIEQKLREGFRTIKMKIGAIDFDTEIKLLKSIRSRYNKNQITLRVDANGAFSPEETKEKLTILNQLDIHSIEQPIKQGQWSKMRELCEQTPLPIALDEELIGINRRLEKVKLLDTIQPQFIILKPSLHGGISGTQEWIELAEERNISWWITSALESNIGLDAICQLAAEYQNPLPQGLGTGSLYVNNIKNDLIVEQGYIYKTRKNS